MKNKIKKLKELEEEAKANGIQEKNLFLKDRFNNIARENMNILLDSLSSKEKLTISYQKNSTKG